MKSRDHRPFAVEHKTKRRSTPTLPASIWGDAVDHFRTPSEQAPIVAPDLIDASQSSPIVAPEPKFAVDVRRVLPDLRIARVEVTEEVVATPVKQRRVHRKREPVVSGSSEEQVEHQIETASAASDLPSETTPATGVETVARIESEDAPEASLTSTNPTSCADIAERQSAVMLALEAAVQTRHRRERTWTRKVDDLPRGERWKRRLPDVCR
jgi:hypothetical protein